MKKERLFSLDLLRGLDMFLLTVIGPVIGGANRAWHLPDGFMAQFRHPWGGFTLWDIIMPLFIFMCGAAIPFALTPRLDGNGRPTAAFWKHVLWRFAMLWALGMCVQGDLLTFDPLRISPYCNTLQTIAAGYLVTALVMLVPSKAFRLAMPVALLAVYGLIVHFGGDYTREGNVTWVFEKKLLALILPAESRRLTIQGCGGYTWFLPTLVFGAITLAGYHSTMVLRSARAQRAKAVTLFAAGAASLAVGWALVPMGVPMVKQIFTVSFTLQAIGWSVLALAALYVLTDILKLRRGLGLIILFGQFALTAYLAHTLFAATTRTFAGTWVQGMPRLFGATAQPFVAAVAESVVIVWVLVIRRRLKAAKA